MNTSGCILGLRDVDKTMLAMVGGKGANLGELNNIEGITVPGGFCITTEAYKRIIGQSPLLKKLVERLSHLKAEDRREIAELSSEIRKVIEGIAIPADISEQVTSFLSGSGKGIAFAIRSSATAEDLPSASFAGQQDTYLNIVGMEEILHHISKCWASLFTERAVTYRIQNGFSHHKVQLSVIVQKMVFPQVAGIMFTADPINGNRKVLSVDASFGLGEALVSGLVNADNYKVRDGKVIDKKISAKKLAVYALHRGGTIQKEVDPALQEKASLKDEQVVELENIGRKIEKHFGSPQDIEWCLADDTFYIVQSRPVTTLFPVPETNDEEKHVYISVGHQQMMTDPMKPLGLSLWQLTATRYMAKAGGRLFVDVTPELGSATGREMLLHAMGQHDPLLKDALVTLIKRGDFVPSLPGDNKQSAAKSNSVATSSEFHSQMENDPAIVAGLVGRSEALVDALKQNIRDKQGTELLDFIIEDIQQLKKMMRVPENMGAIMAAINAAAWLNEKMMEWLGEKNVADTLTQSAPGNITSEMGLALLDVADVIRPYTAIINFLEQTKNDDFLNELVKFKGGLETREAIDAFLDKYGMRCPGEIDITKPRWSEQPTALIPIILTNIKNFEPGAAKRKFEEGLKGALNKEQELLQRLKQLPGGEQKAEAAKRAISLLRNFIGYREYPKYSIVSHSFIYKQALLKEAGWMVQANVIHEKEDIYYLTFEELREAVHTNEVDYRLINSRKDEHTLFEKLNPPRVITSDGEIITGKYNRENLPAAAIVGLAVSSGITEGRARVIVNMSEAKLEKGDILVTTFTDPSWTPLFVSIKGLVTEVGGLMTHGAVIAREYGLPAVVGVENATTLIKDGQRIRVNGTDGYVEIL
ncbi:MAG TPA: phosphoenolpyruvate synthase [Chitinophagaceae bacterium]|nr:phosphoenolpyruvate synthase [Chitinophagaceae bacterium]